MHRIHFRKEDVTIHVPDGANLRQACLDHDIDPHMIGRGKGPMSCHAKGLCATCLVKVDEPGALSQPTKREQGRFKQSFQPPLVKGKQVGAIRQSCQAEVRGDLTVTTSPDKRESWKTHPFYSGRPARSWNPA